MAGSTLVTSRCAIHMQDRTLKHVQSLLSDNGKLPYLVHKRLMSVLEAKCWCRDRKALAQAGLRAFQGNAAHFWAGQRQAKQLEAGLTRARLRQWLQAWQHWAERRCWLRDRLKLVSVACRRTTLTAGDLTPGVVHVMTFTMAQGGRYHPCNC